MKVQKNKTKILIIVVLLLIPVYFIYKFFFSMSALPNGEFLYQVDSPNKEYTINIYVVSASATVADSIRAELVFNDRISKRPKNIYWQYRQSWVDVVWLDNVTVNINGITLDVRKDIYDFRRSKE